MVDQLINNSKRRRKMRKVRLIVVLAGLVLGYGNTALADSGHHGGGQGDAHHASVGGGGDGHSGGVASSHMSDQGKVNNNAQWSDGATTGQDRAELRRNDEGATHNNAGFHHDMQNRQRSER